MRIFQFEKPVLDKIEAVVTAYFAALVPAVLPVSPTVLYLDFEPDEMFIHDTDVDGAVSVYGAEVSFPPGSGSTTGTQDSESTLIIDCYGFGDPIPTDPGETAYYPTVREAHKRAQVLTTLVYKAIMDRQEISGSATVPKNFDTGLDIDDKFPQRIQKFPARGTTESRRGVCAYRSQYQFKLGEDVPEEALGLAFDGPDTIDSPTYNPGDEPA